MLNAVRSMSPFSELTADEERLLGDLVVCWHTSNAITVSDLMSSNISTSPSTTYRRLIALREKGLIYLRVDDNDKRVRFVEPAPPAHDYIERFGKNITELIAGESKI